MNKFVRCLYCLLLYTFILPSGTILGLPIKAIISVLLIIALFLEKVELDRITFSFLISLLFVGLWSIISVVNGYNTYLSFIKNYFSFIFVIWISYYLVNHHIIKINQVIKILNHIVIINIILKILTFIFLVIGLLKIDFLVDLYKNILNTPLTTMYFNIGNIMFYRIMLPNDQIAFVWLSFILISQKSIKNKIFNLIIMAIYTFIIYSRLYFVEFILIILIYLLIAVQNNKFKKNGILVFSFFSFFLLIFVFILLNFEQLEFNYLNALFSRFNSNSSVESDNIRIEQFNFFMSEINNSIFIGRGTGAYLKNYLRSDVIKYSYELEYLSFIYQFGIIGFIPIILVPIIVFWKLALKNITISSVRSILIFNLIVWCIKPFFNPSFLSSNSGLLIVAIILYGSYSQLIYSDISKFNYNFKLSN